MSGLKAKGIGTRAELNRAEAENIRKAVVRYLAAKPSRRSAPFTLDVGEAAPQADVRRRLVVGR